MKINKYIITLGALFFPLSIFSQELYPLSEPASTMPKGVLGIRVFSETFKEWNQWRNMSAIRVMYGLSPKFSVYSTFIASNHHGKNLPAGFPFHVSPERGEVYPYLFNSGSLYLKYRFLSFDKTKEHFRMAAYLEGTWSNASHHEAEPNVNMGDNSGIAGGIITTYLKNRFAASLSLGYTLPFGYKGEALDEVKTLPNIPMFVKYGNSFDYRLSFGYLTYPKKYKSFDQTNLNLYVELVGKKYESTIVRIFDGNPDREYWLLNHNYPPGLLKGWFLDISPSIQFIIKSNTRIEGAVTFPLMGMSYAKLYPVYTLGIQHYFFL